jgi:hypothetical protein
MKTQIILFLLLFFSVIVSAHEEPAKTLSEKKAKEAAKKKISSSGIKKAVMWKYSVTDNKVSEKGTKAIVQEYDKAGNMTAIEAWKNDSLSERVEYSFNTSGDMLTDIDFSADHKMLEKNEYTFDNEGCVISGKSYDESKMLSGYFKIVKSYDKKIVTFLSYKFNDSLDHKFEYKYLSDYDKSDYTEAIKYDSAGTLLLKVIKTYNAEGLAIEKAIFDSDLSLSYTFYYEYDSSRNTTKITKKRTDGTIEWKDVYTIDNNGNCTELNSYDADGKLKSLIRFAYEKY